jgi:hypothetical protein
LPGKRLLVEKHVIKWVHLGITARNEVFTAIFLLGTSFITVISLKAWGNKYFIENRSLKKKAPKINKCNKIGSPGNSS